MEEKWISVKDRLPEEDCEAIIIYGTTGMGGVSYHMSTGRYQKERNRFSGEFDWTSTYYWSPLPNTPEGVTLRKLNQNQYNLHTKK